MNAKGGKGILIAIVGPDGVGKTTLARNLLAVWDGPGRYIHFRPPIIGPLDEYPSDLPWDEPKANAPGWMVLGWVRLLMNLWLFWVGYLVRVRPFLRRQGLVVADRWAFGYVGQPRALRFHGPDWLARTMLKLFPKPTMVVVARAPVSTILSRKQELEPAEISNELEAWGTVVESSRSVLVDTTRAPEELALELKKLLLEHRHEHLAS